MAGQTEVKPVQGACRHMRARYKVEVRRGSHFPEREFLRYECDHGREIGSDEDAEKCIASHAECWQSKA